MKHIVLPSYSIRAGADLHGKVSIFGYSIPIWVEISDVHTLRVVTDLGSVRNENLTKTILEGLIENDLYDNTLLLFSPETGIKTRETTVSSTPLTFVSKGYSLDPTPNDLTQTTELNQPYLSGNIAPNERYASKINKRSETKQLIHPNIVVATPHTVVKVVELETSGKVEITHTEVNGVTLNTLNDVGRVYYYRIHDGSMSVAQKETEATFLRSIYPEIPSVTIGTQTWATSNLEMVATPMGNVIPEVQLASAEEKITNIDDREFNSDTGFWIQGTGWSISGGTLNHITGTTSNVYFDGITIGRWYKVVWTVISIDGSVQFNYTLNIEIKKSVGTYTSYVKSNHTLLGFRSSDDVSIDNVSIQELGWADRQELYDGLIAQGYSVADATKEAAAWAYASNDPNLGAIMGKLYNKYAAKLLFNDITAYNVANPIAHWGWNVPTRAQLTTLSAQGGNASKVGGTNYWTTANGTNTNGLTLLGSGYRQADGTFAELRATTGLLCRDADFARKVLNADNTFDEAAVTLEGYPIRLIKDE